MWMKFPKMNLKQTKNHGKNLKKYLNDPKEGKDITFYELLAELRLIEEI